MWPSSFRDRQFCTVAVVNIIQAPVCVVPCMDVAFKGASLVRDAAWVTITLLLALPAAIVRCAALDAGLWRPDAHGGCTFYEGDVQHARSKPLRNKFRSGASGGRLLTSFGPRTAV